MAAAKKEKEEEEEASKLQLKPAGSKVFSKLLSRESAAAAPSFRVYYGVASAGSVPFLWESQPGTPKNAMSDAVLPPLTPPPSYYTAGKVSAGGGGGGGGRKYGKHGILRLFVLPQDQAAGEAAGRSTQSPTCSSMRSLQGHGGGGRAFGDDDDDDDDGGDDDMAASTACFRVRHESFRAIKNCRVAMTVRSAISSVARRRRRRRTRL
ncbi:hypothetical protein OsJ_00509 [Oryza sativa Japonica Group]|uniref:Uncharacterized protein n=1 Tax=Oryza sativa subsp. japonica TaxID=39947 RepID=B9ET14_ORYSJ|nr:hypothetical protein OsJ_00509 [Oryza sativa Japonica Group]